jgi:hypothetical protein
MKIWLYEKPWHVTIYLLFIDALMPQTCASVSISLKMCHPSFQNLTFLSELPPPLSKILGFIQSKALMAD